MVKVSVIVPVYNAQKYLKECLDSLINQTLKDIEIICIDDKSSDNSYSILQAIRNIDVRIKLYQNENNIGAAETRNKGIDVAQGKYIQFVDADDFLELDSLEKLYTIAEQNDIDMCFLGMKLYQNKNNEKIPDGIVGDYSEVCTGLELLKRFSENNEFFLYLCLVFYRTSFIRQYTIYFKRLYIGEGGDFILSGLCRAKKVNVYKDRLYNYRVNEESITHDNNAKTYLLIGQIVQYVDCLSFLFENQNNNEIQYFLQYQYKKMAGGILNLSKEEQQNISDKLENQLQRYVFEQMYNGTNIYALKLNQNDVDKIRSKKIVIVYGAGYASKEVLELLQKHDIEIKGFAVTKKCSNQTSLYGHHIFEISELQNYCKEAVIIVAANKKYNEEIKNTLETYQFDDYIFLDVEI